jgi:hypothetical protein
MENVVDAFLQVGYLRLQPGDEPFCNFTQEHSRLAGRVYVLTVFDTNRKSLPRQQCAEKGLK